MAVRRMRFENMTSEDEADIAVSSDSARSLLESTMVEHYPFGELQRSLYFLLLHIPRSLSPRVGLSCRRVAVMLPSESSL